MNHWPTWGWGFCWWRMTHTPPDTFCLCESIHCWGRLWVDHSACRVHRETRLRTWVFDQLQPEPRKSTKLSLGWSDSCSMLPRSTWSMVSKISVRGPRAGLLWHPPPGSMSVHSRLEAITKSSGLLQDFFRDMKWWKLSKIKQNIPQMNDGLPCLPTNDYEKFCYSLIFSQVWSRATNGFLGNALHFLKSRVEQKCNFSQLYLFLLWWRLAVFWPIRGSLVVGLECNFSCPVTSGPTASQCKEAKCRSGRRKHKLYCEKALKWQE